MLSRLVGFGLPLRLALLPILLSTVPIVSADLPLAKPEEVGMSSKRLGRINEAMSAYVENEQIAGAVTLVARRGRVVHLEKFGMRDIESNAEMSEDTIFFIASMTKPIVSVALMMLYEEGHFRLADPISAFLPEFKDMTVKQNDRPAAPASDPITFKHVLTHTAGFDRNRVLEKVAGPMGQQRRTGAPGRTLEEYVRSIATVPLEVRPGEKWRYGASTDVVARLVEVISGQPIDEFLSERIFRPLGMEDTFYFVPRSKATRRATRYSTDGGKSLTPTPGTAYREAPPRSRRYLSGVGGLYSTAADYFRFCQMNLNGGEYGGVRILSPKTVQLMTADHTGDLGTDQFRLWGHGFGLGYRVVRNIADSALVGSVGSYGWNGRVGTYFFIDPQEELIGILMTQISPYRHLKIRRQFQILATTAIEEAFQADTSVR